MLIEIVNEKYYALHFCHFCHFCKIGSITVEFNDCTYGIFVNKIEIFSSAVTLVHLLSKKLTKKKLTRIYTQKIDTNKLITFLVLTI